MVGQRNSEISERTPNPHRVRCLWRFEPLQRTRWIQLPSESGSWAAVEESGLSFKLFGSNSEPGRLRNACQFYINPAAFVAPPPGQFGDAPNLFSSLRMPWYFNEDLSVSKRFFITERMDLQFQANFFNAFNRVVWSSSGSAGSQGNAQTFIFNAAPPSLDPTILQNSSTIFGIFTSQQNNPRIIQFGLKLEF